MARILSVTFSNPPNLAFPAFGMERPRGAFVDEVLPQSPAARGGIQNEDIILEFNGHDIEYYTDLPFYVGQYRPGTEAAVRLYRNGELIEQTVVLGSSPTNVAAAEAPAARIERGNLAARVEKRRVAACRCGSAHGRRVHQ